MMILIALASSALAAGFGAGFLSRHLISRQRRLRERQRLGLE